LKALQKIPFIFIRERVGDGVDDPPLLLFTGFQTKRCDAFGQLGGDQGDDPRGAGNLRFIPVEYRGRDEGITFKVIRTDAPPLSLRMALIRSRTGYAPKAVMEFLQLAGYMNWKNLHLLVVDVHE
jgi:hypothetical protein